MNKKTLQDIAFLNGFIQCWDNSGDGDKPAIWNALQKVLYQFCKKNNYPQLSADELLIKIQAEITPEKLFFRKDLSGRGCNTSTTLSQILEGEDEEEDTGEEGTLKYWAQHAEEGDEFNNHAEHYICLGKK